MIEGTILPLMPRVRHKASNGTYRVICGGAYIEADMTVAVIYQSEENGMVFIRPQAEFLDGRFERIE